MGEAHKLCRANGYRSPPYCCSQMCVTCFLHGWIACLIDLLSWSLPNILARSLYCRNFYSGKMSQITPSVPSGDGLRQTPHDREAACGKSLLAVAHVQ